MPNYLTESRNLTRLRQGVVALALAILPVAQAVGAQLTELQQQVWQVTRLGALSEAMASNLIAGLTAQPQIQALSSDRKQSLLAHYTRETTPQRFASALRHTIQHASDEQLQALLDLASSPIARKALTLELAYVPASREALIGYASQLSQNENGRARLHAVQRLDKAIGVSDMAVAIAATSIYGANALQRIESGGPENYDPGSSGRPEAFIRLLREEQVENVQLTYLYVYRDMSLAELQTYVALQEAPSVTSIQKQFMRSLGEEMITIQRDVMREVILDLRSYEQRHA